MALAGTLKKVVKPVYHFLHDSLYNSLDYNPLFSSKFEGKKILKGHISEEHLENPELDDLLRKNLIKAGIPVKSYTIDQSAYSDYLSEAAYPADYYGGGMDPDQNFSEKTLEHFVSTEFIAWNEVSTFVDIAACTSPFSDIVKRKYDIKNVYKQDLVYPPGLSGNQIGGYAHEIALPDASVDAVTLHCSLEHFEGESDTMFFQAMERVLKPGGKLVVLPFYLAGEYTIHVDPVYNLMKWHTPKLDPKARLRYCNWYQFFSRHYDGPALSERILEKAPGLDLVIYMPENFRNLFPGCYLRFVGVFTRKS